MMGGARTWAFQGRMETGWSDGGGVPLKSSLRQRAQSWGAQCHPPQLLSIRVHPRGSD